jgi:hypothetical protein
MVGALSQDVLHALGGDRRRDGVRASKQQGELVSVNASGCITAARRLANRVCTLMRSPRTGVGGAWGLRQLT